MSSVQSDSHLTRAGESAPAPQLHAYVASDFVRAVIDTRTPEQQARDLGAVLLATLRRERRLDGINGTALAYLLSMCYEHGQVEDAGEGHVTLAVRKPVKEIAASLGMVPSSAYRPVQALEEAKLIERIPARGNTPDNYAVKAAHPKPKRPAAEPEPDAGALQTSSAAAQGALQTSSALQSSSAGHPPNCAPEQGLALRARSALQSSSAEQVVPEACQSRFLSDGTDAAQSALQTSSAAGASEGEGEEDIRAGASSSSLPGTETADAAEVVKILKRCGVWANLAKHWSTRISPLDALALEVMKLEQPGPVTGGWCVERLKGGDITDAARRKAQRRLQPASNPTSQTSDGGDDDYRL